MLLVAREFLKRALSLARTRADERLIGERICEVMEMQELEEQRTIAEVEGAGCRHGTTDKHRRGGTNAAGQQLVASDCVDCGETTWAAMPLDWDGTVYVWACSGRRAPRPRRVVI